MVFSRVVVIVALIAFGLSACSSLKTRKEAAEDAKVKAIDEGEEVGPIDDEAINDGLAEIGVDPNQAPESTETPSPEVANEIEKASPSESESLDSSAPPEVAETPEPEYAPPAKKAAAKKAAAKKSAKASSKKTVAKKTSTSKKTTTKKKKKTETPAS